MPHIALRDNNKLNYLDIGRGPPVVLLHGFGMRGAHWLPFISALSLRYRFILPDLRGFGASHQVGLNQSCVLSNYADDLEDLLDGLNLDRVFLGGLSLGAYTSLQYFRRYGTARIHAYAHMDQSPMARNVRGWRWGLFGDDHEHRTGEFRSLLELMDSMDRNTPWYRVDPKIRARVWQMLAAFMGDAVHRRALRVSLKLLFRHEPTARRLMSPDNWPVYMDVMRAYLEGDYDMRESLAGIDVPMTVMVGTESRMYPAPGQIWIKSQVRDANVVCFENCGHALMLDSPRQFIFELAKFLYRGAALTAGDRERITERRAA